MALIMTRAVYVNLIETALIITRAVCVNLIDCPNHDQGSVCESQTALIMSRAV